MVIPSWFQCIRVTDELDCNGNATADGGIRESRCCWRVSCLSATFLCYCCYYLRGSSVRTMNNKQCNCIFWAEKMQYMEKKRLFKWCPLQRWEADSLSAVPAVPLLNSELQEPLALQEKNCRSPFASRSPHGGSVNCSWFTCRACTSVLYLKLHHFSAGAGVGVLPWLKLGKHMTQKKGFEILKETLKAGSPLSKYIEWEKCSVCDHAKG